MSREELASTLLLEDQLKGLTGEKAEEAKKNFEILKATYGVAEAQRMLEEKGVEQLNNQVSVQEQFNATIAKLKEIFVTVANAIMPILSAVASLISLLDPVIQILMMAAALIEDIIGWIGSWFGKDYEFGSAIDRQGRNVESSMEKNWGTSAGLYEMANGGTVTGPTPALIGEAGPEAVIPLGDNSPMIKQANKTNMLLEQLIKKTPEMAPLSLYEVQ